ncbi:PAS domain S-box protein [Benzoatithermus flavus]|uniref:histidine kinase n=1 Tax=Benzoatithermus flavus TaxID=3108223 RepID=A0ABU8XUY0_9PROT
MSDAARPLLLRSDQPAPDFLSGGGELGALIRAHDWANTSLGPPARWPRSLKTAVRIMLTSRQPIWIGWGEKLLYLYNDPYKSIIGGKHPWALGRPTSEVWQEIWDDIGPMLATALRGDEGTYVEQQLLVMERNGYPEETYYTFSYSPIPDDDGGVGGIICANTDDTRRVIGERQLLLLRELAAGTADARTWRDACARSAAALATDPRDLPFAMIYMAEPDGGRVSLAAACGIEAGHAAAPPAVPLGDSSVWPFADVLNGREVRLVPDLAARFGSRLPTGAWCQPPTRAAALPIFPAGEKGRAGVLVVGLNPFRLFDEGYSSFLGLVAGQIAAAIANAQAYEEERKRAEALAEIDRAKTLFFSNVSHEFRTPLTLMMGPMEEVLAKPKDQVPPDDRALIEVAHRNGLRLLKLVNSLLDFSRIEAGRVQAAYEATDLAALTTDLASNFRSACERAGLDLVVDCPPLPEPVYVDREMWEKIVLNLVSNAFKFTFEGAIAVELRPGDGVAVLTVRDTGTGIPASELPRLFERFHRVAGAKGRSYEGSGIGLALVQELVKLHGGTIQVESTEGRGTAFTIGIPFGTGHLPQERIRSERALASTAVRAHAYVEEALRWLPEGAAIEEMTEKSFADSAADVPAAKGVERARVLLADDNADMRDYVRRLLSTRYEVVTVSDGRAALAAVRTSRPDLVITDVMMPHLDGFGVVKALRADPETRDLPVIMLSARAGEEASIEGLEAGADDYLVKPFSARELLARIAANLALSRLRQEATAAIRRSEERLRAALEASGTGTFRWDIRSNALEWDEALDRLFGLPPGRTAPSLDQFLALVHPDDRSGVAERCRQCASEGTDFEMEFRVVWPDGSVRWLYDRGKTFRDAQGRPAYMTGACVDVTLRKRAEALQAAQKRALELAIEDAPLAQVLDMLVRTVEAQSDPGIVSSILLVDSDGRHLRHGAAPSLPEAYTKAIDGLPIGPDVGSCSTAAYTKKPVHIADIATDPLWIGYQDLALSHGLRACWCTPILSSSGEVLGTFATYCRETRQPTGSDLELQEVAARTAALVIERRRASAALSRRTAQFETLLNEAPVGVYLVGADFRIRQVNPTARPIFGDIPDPIGRDFDEVIHILWPKACADEVVERFRHTLETGEPYFVPELVEERRDRGVTEYYEWQINRIPLPEGGYGVVCYFRDISAQVQARRAIAESEQRFRFMAEAMPQKIFTADAKGNITYFNRQWMEFTGLSFEEIEGWGWTRFIHPDDVEENIRVWRHSIDTGEPFELVHRFRRFDGAHRWHLSRAHAMRDAAGNISMWIGSNTEIHEQKELAETLQQKEQALRESEAYLRLMLDAAADGFYCVDREGRTTLCNAAFLRMLGFERAEDVIGRQLHAVIHHAHPDGSPYPSSECPIYRTAQTGRPAHVGSEIFFRTDGTSLPVEYWVHPIFRNGELEGAVCTFIDITERQRAQEQQALLLRELNHRVKNLFAVLGSMVTLSARSASTAEELAKTLRGRLDALARAHELIRPGLTGMEAPADRSVTLEKVVREVLSPYADPRADAGRGRFVIEGPVVGIGSSAVTSLALALHELTTNAAKYGALSEPDGRVLVGWSLEDGELLLEWHEKGGPALAGPPAGRGFGSLLAEGSVTGQLGGRIAYDWRPEGLAVQIRVPAENLGR